MDPDPAIFLNADPDPSAFLMRIRIKHKQICENLPYEEFSGVEKTQKKFLNRKTRTVDSGSAFILLPGSGSRGVNFEGKN